MSLQREPFLTMFYTINLFTLLVTKKGFMLIIILSKAVSETATSATATARSPASAYSSTLVDALI